MDQALLESVAKAPLPPTAGSRIECRDSATPLPKVLNPNKEEGRPLPGQEVVTCGESGSIRR